MKKIIYTFISVLLMSCETTQKGNFEITTTNGKIIVDEIKISEYGFKFKRNGEWIDLKNDSVEVREISP